ncbi:hypothetical protein OEA41_000070 [Lepraria neglecta]|uniref:Squalene cyclase C-terminal domain-containing protein n=1 Tax=Lepraria neglecta TaxID=209136 RepID=A0AAD9ZHX5_9LECA|nr:hypothetical protein OEA41_000070 [Lepraria neglecta]
MGTPLAHTVTISETLPAYIFLAKWHLYPQQFPRRAMVQPGKQKHVLALRLEGFSMDDVVITRVIEAMERFTIKDKHGKGCQSCVSPVWDTALMTIALRDSGLFPGDKRLQRVVAWIKALQPTLAPGGWSFQGFVTLYADVDDTAAVVLALLKESTYSIDVPCISRAATWMLGMQNRDRGWGAFDHNNDQISLERLPFSDMGTI